MLVVLDCWLLYHVLVWFDPLGNVTAGISEVRESVFTRDSFPATDLLTMTGCEAATTRHYPALPGTAAISPPCRAGTTTISTREYQRVLPTSNSLESHNTVI